MRIVFIGSVYFSFKILEHLLKLNTNIVGVISKKKSNYNSDFYDLSSICKDFNIPNLMTNDINSEKTVKWIKDLKPDVKYCFGWSNIIKPHVLKLSKKGVIGFHPTLLPLNRGRHPLIWAKALGLKESGTTFFVMDQGIDSGPIISQKRFRIDYKDTSYDIYKKIINNSLKQVEQFTIELGEDREKKMPQPKKSNYWRKREKSDGEINFSSSSDNIINLVRALTKPYPGATCSFEGQDIIIWSIEKGKNQNKNIEPGKVLSVNKRSIEVKTGDFSVILVDHEFSTIPKLNQYIK